MAIKLSKVCPELGVGLQTVVEYCAKIGREIPMNLNIKIDDDLYLLLQKKFLENFDEKQQISASSHTPETNITNEQIPDTQKTEKEIVTTEKPNVEVKIVGSIDLTSLEKKSKSSKKTQKTNETIQKTLENQKITEDKQDKLEETPPAETNKTTQEPPEIMKTVIPQPHLKVVGSIDIDSITKTNNKKTKKTAKKENSKKDKKEREKTNENIIPTTVVNLQEEQKEENTKKTNDILPDNIKPITEEKETTAESIPITNNTADNQIEKQENEIYKIPVAEVVSQPKIVGKIDLASINQIMRPARKTKLEKLKEREEKHNLLKKEKNAEPAKEEKIAGTQKNVPTQKKNVFPKTVSETNEIDITDNTQDTKKRKRERIHSNKVDITNEQHPKIIKNKRERKNYKIEINSEEVHRQVKDTFARLNSNKGKTTTSKHKRERREMEREKMAEARAEQKASSTILKLTEFVTANDLAVMMDVPVNKVIATCMTLGILVSINQRLDAETINIVAEEFGFTTEYVSSKVVEKINMDEVVKEEDIETRCPVVTVMGHVDHGKTSLLDHIRNTNVIAGEAGGITQHIGAYNVQLKNGQHITFLDTPGHEAFTAMRARGTKLTDIAIIVIAADDAIMPQTVEAINHALAANVPMIFAINKCDKPDANPEKIKEQLANMNILVEDWGGKYQSQNISAKKGDGVYELLEKVLLEAELLDLKANPKRRAKGTVVESSLDKGRGYVATVLVSDGTLHMGDIILAGTYHGKIKAMFNERGKRIEQVLPGEPCSLLGFNGAPQAGDEFNVLATEQEARSIANKREQLQREQSIRTRKHLGLEEIGRRLAIGDFKELNIIVKGDVDGSVEALTDSLIKLSSPNIQVNVIHGAVGAISDSDVLLAVAANAIIIGFNVRPNATARKMADLEEVDIRIYSVIYDAIDDVKAAMSGMLSPEIKEEVTATIEVMQTFHISKVGTIAGCIVRDGKAKRTNKCRIIRDGIVIHTGEILSLKHGKDDIKEVGVNQECGISVKSFNDIKEHDIIETYEQVEVAKPL